MTSFKERNRRGETITVRIRTEDRELIDRAARAAGKSRSAFVAEAATKAAQEALLDQAVFHVTPAVYAEYVALLDAEPQPNERLKRTMRNVLPWIELSE